MNQLLAAAAAAGIIGYAAGRTRPARTSVRWARNQVALKTSSSLNFWIAVPIVVIGLALLWALHPRRSAANVRTWDESETPVPTPRRDPDWPAPAAPDPAPGILHLDDGPPHNGLLCMRDGWLCRYPAGDGHDRHAPYAEGEYRVLISKPAAPHPHP